MVEAYGRSVIREELNEPHLGRVTPEEAKRCLVSEHERLTESFEHTRRCIDCEEIKE